MRNIRFLIQYDGTGFNGWQKQLSGTTIQGLIEAALEKVTSMKTEVIAAGRTDAGVHALGQSACFRTESVLSADILRNAVNAHLPLEIRIMEACDVADDFHARFSAGSKSYVYLLSMDRIMSPFMQRYVWRVPQKLDIEAMRKSAELLRGRHDFSAFRASGCGAKSPVRTITEATIDTTSPVQFLGVTIETDMVRFRFEGDAFLRHMVRNMVGTLVEVGKGSMQPEYISELLAACDRRCAGPTAPAHGLFMEKIVY